jgi:hypothetical protein
MLCKRNLASSLVLAAVLVTAVGCDNAEFKKLPSRQEMNTQTRDQIRGQYSDFKTYGPGFVRDWIACPIWDMPSVDPMLDSWGEPDVKRLSWLNLIPFTMVPPFHPLSVYKWRFDGKEVVTRIDHPLGRGYDPCVWTLRLRERVKASQSAPPKM